jgi:hypothetical protein
MSYGIKCVTVCACDWLLFLFYHIYILYAIISFNYWNMLRCNQAVFSRQRCLLSSCAKQTLLSKLQGISDCHIPLPKRQYQQACYWQPVARQNHPIIKRTSGEIHNYYFPLTRHKEFRVRWDWVAEMQHKNHKKNKLNLCLLICGSFISQLQCFYNMALIKYVGIVS